MWGLGSDSDVWNQTNSDSVSLWKKDKTSQTTVAVLIYFFFLLLVWMLNMVQLLWSTTKYDMKE